MRKRKLSSFLLAIASVSVALVVAEVLLPFYDPVDIFRPPENLSEDLWRGLLHQPSPIPGLAYELAPGREGYSRGAMVKINSLGMRDDEPRSKDDASLSRIAVIGDSIAFGFGVREGYTFSSVLERLLQGEMGSREFEVLNFGVSGYSSRDEALLFQHKVVDWDLDLVIVQYFFNDPEIDPVQPLQAFFQETGWWRYSNLLRLIVKAKGVRDIAKYGEGDYARYLHAEDGHKWKKAVSSLGEIKQAADVRGVPVLLVIFPVTTSRPWTEYAYLDLHQQVGEAVSDMGMHVLDLYEDFSRFPSQSLVVGPHDNHPGEAGHDVAARAMHRWVLANKGQVFHTS